MNWFKKWIFESVQTALKNQNSGLSQLARPEEPPLFNRGEDHTGAIQLTVIPALNGRIIQVTTHTSARTAAHYSPPTTEYYLVGEGDKLLTAMEFLVVAKNMEKT